MQNDKPRINQNDNNNDTNTSKYVCDFCGWKAHSAGMLVYHKNSHKRQNFCKICKKYVGDTIKFAEHMRTHGKAIYRCRLCREEFSSEHNLNIHRDTIHNTKVIQESSSVSNANEILEEVRPYKCHICGWRSKQFWCLKFHRRIHDRNDYFCRICQNTMNSRADYLLHMGSHGEAIYKCHQCGEEFPTREMLNIHMEGHPYNIQVCHICGKMYPREQLKTYNVQTPVKQSHKCIVCGGILRLLYRTSTDMLRKFKCDPCNKLLVVKPVFLKKLQVAKKPFKCKICEARFSNGDLLRRHMTIHRIEKEFKCPVCSEVLSNEYKFYVHKKSHQAENCDTNKIEALNICVKEELLEEIKCEETIISNLEENHEVTYGIHQVTSATSNNSFEENKEFRIKTEEGDVEFSILRSALEADKNNCKEEIAESEGNASSDMEYVCGECGKTFGNNDLLIVHSKMCNKLQKEQVFVCQSCSV